MRAHRRGQPHLLLERPADQLREVAPADVFHRDVERAVPQPDLEDAHHVGVVERRRHPRLVEELVHQFLLLREVRQQRLQDDGPLEPRDAALNGEEHLAHAPDGDAVLNLVLPEDQVVAHRGEGAHQTCCDRR